MHEASAEFLYVPLGHIEQTSPLDCVPAGHRTVNVRRCNQVIIQMITGLKMQ
jgi:hypothetical protein